MEGFEELKAREALEELNEAKRLLYVAFTRAEEEVFGVYSTTVKFLK